MRLQHSSVKPIRPRPIPWLSHPTSRTSETFVRPDNELTSLPARFGGSNAALDLLKTVDARNNQLTECGEALWELPALKMLILAGNPLADPYMLGVPDDGATSTVVELDLCTRSNIHYPPNSYTLPFRPISDVNFK